MRVTIATVRKRLELAILLLLTMLFTGCGGGGTGNSGDCTTSAVRSNFQYVTEWTSGSAGNSQVVSFFNPSGGLVQSQILNRSANNTTVQIDNIDSGNYSLVVALFSGADGGGTLVGEIRTKITVCRGTSFRSKTGGTPVQVTLLPLNSSTLSNGSIQFSAYPIEASGDALFVTPGTINWTALGGVGTIDSNGLFSATTAGTGTIRASIPGGLQTGVPVTVISFTPVRKKWTVLVYMNAANDLYAFSTLNMNQMEQVAGNPDVRFIVQWKQAKNLFPSSTFDGTRRYHVIQDNSNQVVSQPIQDLGLTVDMGDWRTLRDFVAWGATNYPSDRTVLIVWNHGNGWKRAPKDFGRAVSYDDDTGNAILIPELSQALAGRKFDILAWDASLMQMIEVAYQVRSHADYVVGSEESPPGEGYPYHLVFAPFRDSPDASTVDLSKGFVDGMLSFPQYASRKITQSVVDTTKLDDLTASVSTLANALVANRTAATPAIQAARAQAQSYSPNLTRTYRDLYDVCEILKTHASSPSAVVTAATDVQAKLISAIVWEGHNANSPRSNGLSIDFSTAGNFTPEYSTLAFALNSTWDSFLSVAP